MYISQGSLKDADALTAKMKELIISLAHYRPHVSPPFYPDNRTIPFNQCCLVEYSSVAAVKKMHLNK